jgi:hypothetical protein
LARDAVHRIASEAGRCQSPPIEVVAVTGQASSSYAEVLFSAPTADHDVLIGVFRDRSEQSMRASIDAKLHVVRATTLFE